jgi:hypothetical protein
VRRLAVTGLSLAETREMIQTRLRRPAQGLLVRELHRRTEGNPLFLEEILDQMLARETGPETPLPSSLQEALRARFVSLERSELRLLQFASVIGERFDTAMLAHLSRRTETAVREALIGLCEKNLVRSNAPEADFRFWHALTRDALYDQLVVPDRKALHRRVAQRLVATADEANPADVGYHLEKAGEELDPSILCRRRRASARGLCLQRSLLAFGASLRVSRRPIALALRCKPPAMRGSPARSPRPSNIVSMPDAPWRRAPTGAAARTDAARADLHWLAGDGARASQLLNDIEALSETSARRTRRLGMAPSARQLHRACMESRWSDGEAPAAAALAMSRRLNLPLVEATSKSAGVMPSPRSRHR